MDDFFSSSKEMAEAQRKAIAELKAMSFEELMRLSDENMDSPTVDFLLCCSADKPLQQTIVLQEDKVIAHEHYAVAKPSRCLEGLKHFVGFYSGQRQVHSDSSQGFALGGFNSAMAA